MKGLYSFFLFFYGGGLIIITYTGLLTEPIGRNTRFQRDHLPLGGLCSELKKKKKKLGDRNKNYIAYISRIRGLCRRTYSYRI